ncbi:MAG: hypothetical protein RL637_1011 [Pseudomonadota bacterium]|jgi:glycosyltransferase involved in cell wall biosynthesis
MKITMIMSAIDMSGGAKVCAIYAQKMQDRGHIVNIIAPKKKLISFKQQLKNVLKGIGWKSTKDQLQNHFDLMQIKVIYVKSKQEINADNIPDADVIIATWWETAEWIKILPNSKGIKVHFIQGYEVFSWLPIERVEAVYRLPFYKITISKTLVSTMEKYGHSSQLYLVPNAVDFKQFFAVPRNKQLRPTIGFLYSECPLKGIDVALKVIENVKIHFPELRILCFGSQKPNKYFPNYIEFEYNPKQDHLRDIYAQCDVWLCCSRSEGFHLPPLEAMACRCPLISTKVGGPEDIVQQGINGFLCEIDDVNDLANKVIQILNSSEEEWQYLSKSALETATKYTWDDAANLFEKVLEKCIESSLNKDIP